jgi:hypothetical protein
MGRGLSEEAKHVLGYLLGEHREGEMDFVDVRNCRARSWTENRFPESGFSLLGRPPLLYPSRPHCRAAAGAAAAAA